MHPLQSPQSGDSLLRMTTTPPDDDQDTRSELWWSQTERQLRIDLMGIQIDKGRLDIDRVRQEIQMENRKFALQAIIACAAILAAGVAIGRFVLFHA
jgi:hypothetical protein